jgi:hypothetical protein
MRGPWPASVRLNRVGINHETRSRWWRLAYQQSGVPLNATTRAAENAALTAPGVPVATNRLLERYVDAQGTTAVCEFTHAAPAAALARSAI